MKVLETRVVLLYWRAADSIDKHTVSLLHICQEQRSRARL